MSHPLDPSNPLDMGIFPQIPRDQWPQPRVMPTPTLRQLQMQAALRAAAPRGGGRDWQAGGAVGMKYGGGVRPTFPPFPPRGDPDRRTPPTLTPSMLSAGMARRANQARRLSSRGPGGWYAGGDVDVDSREALMAEREMLQQQLQMADEVTAREIMAQIMEINKELEMEARNFGMAGGGLASLMGG